MLKLENLKKVYDGVTILENINLNIEDGEIISILGPSGCGKTTLLNLILGIAEADGGHIVFNGQDITDVPMEKRGFNIVFQDYALFPNLNVYENITYGLRNNPHFYRRGGSGADRTSWTGRASEQKNRSAFRWSETENRTCKNNGNEAQNPSFGRAFKRS